MILRVRRRRVSLLALALAAVLAGCQNLHVKLGEPSAVRAAAPAPKASFPNPGNIPGGQVMVRRGETIYQVSQRTGAPVRDLIDANHLQPPYRLAAGRTLIVPRTPTYVVRRGDTIYSIAERQGVELYSLARMNELTRPFALTPGEVLKLPPTVSRPLASERPLPNRPQEKPAPIATTQLAPVGSRSTASVPPPGQKPEEASLMPSTQAPSSQPSAMSAPETPLPAPPPRAGRFLWPVQGRVIGRYGTSAAGTHNDGINIAAPKGTPVRAADAGVVAYAGNELRGYGDLILIKHAGGWMTAYAHNGSILVHRGEVVNRGQEIATVGATGIVSEPQLHFEIRKGTRAFDPTQYMSPQQASVSR